MPGLKAGQTYNLEIRLENEDVTKRGAPFISWGGIRLGGARKIDYKLELEHAVKLAKEADGERVPSEYVLTSDLCPQSLFWSLD